MISDFQYNNQVFETIYDIIYGKRRGIFKMFKKEKDNMYILVELYGSMGL